MEAATTRAYSIDEVSAGRDAIMAALHTVSPLTEEELMERLGQTRGLLVIAGSHLERNGRLTVYRGKTGRTYRLTVSKHSANTDPRGA